MSGLKQHYSAWERSTTGSNRLGWDIAVRCSVRTARRIELARGEGERTKTFSNGQRTGRVSVINTGWSPPYVGSLGFGFDDRGRAGYNKVAYQIEKPVEAQIP